MTFGTRYHTHLEWQEQGKIEQCTKLVSYSHLEKKVFAFTIMKYKSWLCQDDDTHVGKEDKI